MSEGAEHKRPLRPLAFGLYNPKAELSICPPREDRSRVHYISTRGEASKLGFEDVLLAGLARDGGLYVPESWPALSRETIAGFAGKPFAEVAVEVIHPFTGGAITRSELRQMADEAYRSFGHPAVTPLVQIDRNTWILELFHGPTLAFKDVAMQLLARLMDHVLAKRGSRATIVGATSGDTGGAAIEAFRGRRQVDVVILFPDGRVSDVQRRMMTTPTDPNVHAVAVEGTFDDCQALVKGMFNDHGFRDRVGLSGVNSINWARIVAQVTYYFVAAVALGAPFRKVTFAVPTGNFGDIFAGYVAKRMGLPVEALVIASNANDILPRAYECGTYEMKSVQATTSPSMDIQISSNFERYLFEASGRDAALIRAQMGLLGQGGRFELKGTHATMRQDFRAAAASEADIAAAIRKVDGESGYLMDPHTACGYVALAKTSDPGPAPAVILSTAHPAKFPDAIEAITGRSPALPARLSNLMTDAERFLRLPNDLARIETYVAERARAAGGKGRG
jgi:threonine synthase